MRNHWEVLAVLELIVSRSLIGQSKLIFLSYWIWQSFNFFLVCLKFSERKTVSLLKSCCLGNRFRLDPSFICAGSVTILNTYKYLKIFWQKIFRLTRTPALEMEVGLWFVLWQIMTQRYWFRSVLMAQCLQKQIHIIYNVQ